MNMEDFEQRLSRQPWRPVPPAWRAEVLAAAHATPAPRSRERLWEQLHYWLWPSPRAWAVAAAVWVIMLTGNLWLNLQIPARAVQPVADAQFLDHLRHRQRVIVELLDVGEAQESPAKDRSIPRGEWRGGHRLG